jgi:hypothetical protein
MQFQLSLTERIRKGKGLSESEFWKAIRERTKKRKTAR